MAGRLLALLTVVGLTVSCGPQPSPALPTGGSPSGQAELQVQAADITRHLDALARIADENNGARTAGTPGYDASADYVAHELAALGYSVQRSQLDFPFFDEAAPVALAVGDRTWSGRDWLHAMLYSASGSASGTVQAVGIVQGAPAGTAGCNQADWAGFTAGSVALVMSGPCFRLDQVLLAQRAGASAVVALYPSWAKGQIKRPTLVDPHGIEVPAIAVGQEPADALLSAAENGTTASVETQVTLTQAHSASVIGELAGDSDRVVMLGGHLDSVLDGPGINDNGSGVATLLAIAAALASGERPRVTVRFAFWTAEEFGDLGSRSYVDGLDGSELARIDAYLNLDMVGSPNAARYVYDDALAAPGSGQLRDALIDALARMGQPGTTEDLSGQSDHYAFAVAGIPTGGVFSGLAPLTEDEARTFGGTAGVPADACYHLACDVRDNVNLQSAMTLGQAVARVLDELAF
jgi:Zn-dependent M28 family amino/carboxypeptidase